MKKTHLPLALMAATSCTSEPPSEAPARTGSGTRSITTCSHAAPDPTTSGDPKFDRMESSLAQVADQVKRIKSVTAGLPEVISVPLPVGLSGDEVCRERGSFCERVEMSSSVVGYYKPDGPRSDRWVKCEQVAADCRTRLIKRKCTVPRYDGSPAEVSEYCVEGLRKVALPDAQCAIGGGACWSSPIGNRVFCRDPGSVQ